MMTMKFCWRFRALDSFLRFSVGSLGLVLASSAAQADVLVPFGADWRYRIGTGEASSPIEAWRSVQFSDASWNAGLAPVGYGEPDIVTSIPSSSAGGWLSVFFRCPFKVANPAGVSQLDLTVRIDDGFVAWINGVEIGRSNVPDGDLAFNRTAISAIEPVTVTLTLTNDLGRVLLPGTNMLAIQAFNANSGSSDLLLDAQLTTTSDTTPPEVVELVPPAGATVRDLRQVEAIFSENVTGVDASDLLVNNRPANGIRSVSPRDYIFSFAEPATGMVQVAWASAHQISDLASPPNLFPGGAWSYRLDKTMPPPTVMISEFMADNTTGIRDNDGNRSDWIELLNAGAEAVDLDGWFLTDDTNNLTKWRFPSWNLAPNTYLLVWASEKDRAQTDAPLHTNFKLSAEGEFLALVDPQTNIVSAFAPAYPVQQPNTSFGRDRTDPTLTGYFVNPTPGAPNSTAGAGFAPAPVFSLLGGTYTNDTLTVVITAPAGEIRYTLDGSTPTQSSLVYTQPLLIDASTLVQARVFQAGFLPGPVVAQDYTLLAGSAAGFSSNLPLMIINTFGRSIPQDQRIRAAVSTFEPRDGRARLINPPDFDGGAQIEVRGQTSAGFPKQPYNLEIDDSYGNDLEVPLLGLPAESDWVLHNPYSDKCLMNNFLAFELHRQMGHYAPRCRFVEVFVKTSRGRVSYPGDYRGVYVLMEKIKVAGNRVDLARLTPDQNREPELTGGYIVKKDKDSPGDLSFTTQGGGGFGGQYLKFHEPKPREITFAQRNWITAYLNQFERCLYASDWLRRTGTNHYSHYIDVDSFVDNHWIVEFTKQIDGYRLSNYMSKDRGGPLRMDPIWDWNLALGNADYLEGWSTNGWYYPLISAEDHIWLRRLICGTTDGYAKQGDPDFNQRIIDRWSVLRTNVLSAARVTARIDEIAADLNEAQARDFSKYPRLNTYVWPNPSFYIAPTYAQIIQAMKRWVEGRFGWIDSQFLKTPSFNQPGGPVAPGSTLTLSAPTGSILFTLDGTDPRLPGGGTSPAALTYANQALLLDRNVRVFARARSGTTWSGPAVATFIVQTPPLRITELMYHPAARTGDTNSAENFEFIELKNTGASELDLVGFRISEGVDYAFTTSSAVTKLAPGAHVLIVKNKTAFVARHPEALARVAGEYSGTLNNAGERLILEGPLSEPILDFTYDPGWYPATDGLGFSLVLRDHQAPVQSWNDPFNWRPSAHPGGSPGADDPVVMEFPAVRVNEALSLPDPGGLDAIELYNPESIPADIGGWFLSDDFGTPLKYRIPNGTILGPGQFKVFSEAEFGSASTGFALNSLGDEVYLFSGNGTELTGYAHGFRFGAAVRGVSFGRHVTSVGEERFVAQLEPTWGGPNAGPRVGPVVINEIMFDPPRFTSENNTADEYVELLNVTNQSVPLFDPASSTNTWRLSGGVEFEFPTGVSLPPGGLALIVSFDPANTTALVSFQNRYHLPSAVPVFGPWGGNLDNRGERLSLLRPDPRSGAGEVSGNTVPYVLVDEVRYGSSPAWPVGANSTGKSLQRIVPSDYGDDPLNWIAVASTAGMPNPGLATDTDADGLPDPWELVYFGDLTAGPDEDADSDGVSNLDEYTSGTKPTDAGSVLTLKTEALPGRAVRLSFQAAAGRNYSLWFADALGGSWQKWADFPAQPESRELSTAVDASSQARFYRLSVTRP